MGALSTTATQLFHLLCGCRWSFAAWRGTVCCNDWMQFNCSVKELLRICSTGIPAHWDVSSSSLIFWTNFLASCAKGRKWLGWFKYSPSKVWRGILMCPSHEESPRCSSSMRLGSSSLILCSLVVSPMTGLTSSTGVGLLSVLMGSSNNAINEVGEELLFTSWDGLFSWTVVA